MHDSTVRVGAEVDRPVEVTWRALVEPAEVGRWFGDLDRPWEVGRPSRIDFGDGDFFVATPLAVVAHRSLEFEWSFLGVGPPARVRWAVGVLPHGTRVDVVDVEPGRGAAEAGQLRDGWTDFLGRLVGYLDTGRGTRYAWREDVDGAVDLPPGFAALSPDELVRWLPVATDGFTPSWFFVVDADGPRRFPVVDWVAAPDRLDFGVELPGGHRPTRCAVLVEHAPSGTRLRFTHGGWATAGLPDGRAGELRRRFAATWTAALHAAADLARRRHG
ncbi:SRPBCC family protein [Saccharothrix obliqua]|uniref:SRPBCC family protein n=1 Tax=Saccharothrix obliqua TaxID=2861747 RepID=UPI001C5E5D17|nr:SRPBCC domain-containing protein [Saccharothrix obliqua]MBW4721432.1 SRPBCC domain-containing protein [Saccharothrix obliqua]